MDQDRIQRAIAEVIEAIGEDPKREGIAGTPERVAEMFAELFSGLRQDPCAVLSTGFDEAQGDPVVLRDLRFHSMCEHHFLPFFGVAHVGYVPRERVVGISKLARALDILAHRPQLQERLTAQLADAIMDAVRPEGVAVVIEAEHLCMSMRGIQRPGATVATTAVRESPHAHQEVGPQLLSLLRGK